MCTSELHISILRYIYQVYISERGIYWHESNTSQNEYQLEEPGRKATHEAETYINWGNVTIYMYVYSIYIYI